MAGNTNSLRSKLFDKKDYDKPIFAEVKRYFDGWWNVFQIEQVKFSYSDTNRAWEYAQIMESVEFIGKTVLDLGSSRSLIPIYMVRMLGCTVTTLEMAWKDEREFLYEKAGITPHVKCDLANLMEPLPYKDGAFEIVTCFSTLEHLSDYTLALKEMKRVCRKGGFICLTTDFAPNTPTGEKSGITFNRQSLEKLIKDFGIPLHGESDFDTVDLTNPENLAVDGRYTFASLVFRNE
jgi:SAM-dependent methyltransferase